MGGLSGIRVLVVDDMEQVRRTVAQLLELHGAEVWTATGLREVEEQALTVDVAIVDIHLGADRGCDVIAALRQRQPSLPVVAMSGGALEPPQSISPTDHFLRKPFGVTALVDAVLAVVRAGRDSRLLE